MPSKAQILIAVPRTPPAAAAEGDFCAAGNYTWHHHTR